MNHTSANTRRIIQAQTASSFISAKTTGCIIPVQIGDSYGKFDYLNNTGNSNRRIIPVQIGNS